MEPETPPESIDIIPPPSVFSTALAPDINALVRAKLIQWAKKLLGWTALSGAGALAGMPVGIAIHAASAVEAEVKEVIKVVPGPDRIVDRPVNVEVIKYVDRVVEVPAKLARFASICPKCGTNHWAYPPGTGSTGEATGRLSTAK